MAVPTGFLQRLLQTPTIALVSAAIVGAGEYLAREGRDAMGTGARREDTSQFVPDFIQVQGDDSGGYVVEPNGCVCIACLQHCVLVGTD
jgi:hypothetical protein